MPRIPEVARQLAEKWREELRTANPERSFDAWVEILETCITDFYCYAATRESFGSLENKAKNGDDESLLKLVKIFKNAKYVSPFIMARCRRAEREEDLEFERRYAEALLAKPLHDAVNLPLMFHLILYRDFVESRTAREVLDFFERELGLRLQADPQTLGRYCQRMGIRTGGGKRGKRKKI